MLKYNGFFYRMLMNPLVITIIILFNIFWILAIYISSHIIDGYYYLDMYRVDYYETFFEDSYMIMETIIVILAVLFTSFFNSEETIKASKYLIDRRSSKRTLFFSKITTLSLILGYILLVFILEYYVFIILATPFKINILSSIQIYFKIFLELLYFIVMTNLLLNLFPSILINILPIGIFWYMEANSNLAIIKASKSLDFIYKIVPNVLLFKEKLILYGDYLLYLIIILIILLVNCWYFVKKDIN